MITEQWLSDIGFTKVHMNPNYNGGFFRYYLSLPKPYSSGLMVSFRDGYEPDDRDFTVWIEAGMTMIAVIHAVTVEDLQTLCRLLCGKTLEECVAEASAMDR